MDRGGFQQKTITFVIKTPNLAHGDQTVEGVDMDWTVVDLKRHLSAVYPSKPAVSDQRLIYSGKLLPDHLHLRDIFRQTDCAPTLHLVCSARAPARGPLGARPKVRETEQLHAASASTAQTSSTTPLDRSPSSSPVQSTPTPPPVQSTPTPPPVQSTPATPPVQSTPATPELRQRRHVAPAASTPQPHHTQTPAWPGTAVPGVAEMAQPSFPTYSLYSPQQLLWLQHVYARQYYMQYHAALAAAGHGTASLVPAATTFGPYPPVPAHHHPAPVPAALPNQNPIEPLAPANQNAGAQDGAFIDPAAAANQNLRMNAQGGPVMEDEEDVERDWLDWVYTVARLAVFLSIVYFYSTLSRFVLVMSSLLLMYLHTAGWFPFRRRPLVQGPNQQRPQAQQPPQAQQNPAPGEEPADGERAGHDAAGEGPEGQGPMTAVLVPPYRVSVMWTAWVFFKSFFSSLIPEAQQGVAN